MHNVFFQSRKRLSQLPEFHVKFQEVSRISTYRKVWYSQYDTSVSVLNSLTFNISKYDCVDSMFISIFLKITSSLHILTQHLCYFANASFLTYTFQRHVVSRVSGEYTVPLISFPRTHSLLCVTCEVGEWVLLSFHRTFLNPSIKKHPYQKG